MMVDKLLIWKFKQGSRVALRLIYDKYHMDLLKLAMVLTNDVHDAEDIVHDVFVKFAESVHRFSLSGSLKGYLITSTVNRVRNLQRDKQRHGTQALDDAGDVPTKIQQPDQWAIVSEQLACLSRAMASLSYEQREVIMLRMQMNMTFRVIARRQRTSTSTVQGRYRYGIDKLRSLLDGELVP